MIVTSAIALHLIDDTLYGGFKDLLLRSETAKYLSIRRGRIIYGKAFRGVGRHHKLAATTMMTMTVTPTPPPPITTNLPRTRSKVKVLVSFLEAGP